MTPPRIAVLAYHASRIQGDDYDRNDHIALAQDLQLLARLDLPVLPLHAVAAIVRGEQPGPASAAVALSFDDGTLLDWAPCVDPEFGPQPGFRAVLQAHRDATGRAVHGTSFVIASPEARAQMDRVCLRDAGWMGQDWWPDAAAGDLIAIENHSWDHNHAQLDHTAQRAGRKGDFYAIETWGEADAEIRRASDWIDMHRGHGHTTLFAYPYGHIAPYLAQDYLPNHTRQHRLRAAFGTDPRPLAPGDNPWTLGRYVSGWHWTSPGALETLLRDALRLG